MENESEKSTPVTPKLDPLRRVLIPIEKKNIYGEKVFKTLDQTTYIRDPYTNQIRRVGPKKFGKAAKKAAKREACRSR
jgi:hypothetical protein